MSRECETPLSHGQCFGLVIHSNGLDRLHVHGERVYQGDAKSIRVSFGVTEWDAEWLSTHRPPIGVIPRKRERPLSGHSRGFIKFPTDESIVSQTHAEFRELGADFVQRSHSKVLGSHQLVRSPLAQLARRGDIQASHTLARPH